MSLTELLPEVRALSHGDKLQLMRVLTTELAQDDPAQLIASGESYPIWSPFDAYAAADELLKLLPQSGQ